jgi:hypothetical protein
MSGLLPALVAVVGLILYALSSNPKAAEVGLFAAGAFAFCFAFATRAVHLF